MTIVNQTRNGLTQISTPIKIGFRILCLIGIAQVLIPIKIQEPRLTDFHQIHHLAQGLKAVKIVSSIFIYQLAAKARLIVRIRISILCQRILGLDSRKIAQTVPIVLQKSKKSLPFEGQITQQRTLKIFSLWKMPFRIRNQEEILFEGECIRCPEMKLRNEGKGE